VATSPYAGKPETSWVAITESLVKQFPAPPAVLVDAVKAAWDDLYLSSIGSSALVIGRDIFLPAQATGVILERLIAIQLSRRAAGWRPGNRKTEKDIVCIKNPAFSFEIKTSSSKSGLYGNRSTGHISSSRTKVRTGYYLVLNYTLPTEESAFKAIQLIRFGWIDDEDWKGQDKPTGQQASIGANLAVKKLKTLFGAG
jgi:hypothetical protein